MAKKELKMRAVVAPTETVIVSAYDENGKADACTLAFYMVSSHVPPCVTIAINATQKRKTLKDILETKAFVLGFPRADQVREADYIGVESGYNADKLKDVGFTVSEARRAPDARSYPGARGALLPPRCRKRRRTARSRLQRDRLDWRLHGGGGRDRRGGPRPSGRDASGGLFPPA